MRDQGMLRANHVLGGYREDPPPANWVGMLECQWRHAIDGITDPRCPMHRVLPDPSVSLAFLCWRDGEGRVASPRLALIGPIFAPYTLALQPGHEIVALKLNPEWSRPLLGVQAGEHIDRIDDLGSLHIGADPLLDALAATRHWSEASRLISGFLSGQRSRLDTLAGRVARQQQAAAALRAAQGRSPVAAAADQCGVGTRHFRRLFEAATGVSPKSYSRARRFLRVLIAADRATQPDWAGLALAGGYSDQAHLVHEFRDIAGCTPTVLLRERRLEAGLYQPRS